MHEMEFDALKLIIWDLDETFWKGILSEGEIQCPKEHINLIVDLSKRGIVNSIASKNDYQVVRDKLVELGVWDYFVFPSVSWEAKGPRIAALIKDANLKPKNVLFIDDNPTNLGEAAFFCEQLNTATPEIIRTLIENVSSLGKDDSELSRLRQYKQLERKRKDEMQFADPMVFLRQSNVRVAIKDNCKEVFDRLLEMIGRTNQLNYTKLRITRKELSEVLDDNDYRCAYVLCHDNYGDYGIVGFYALHKPMNQLTHFLFSCRTMGLNIESFIYKFLGCPSINVVPPVTIDLNPALDFSYIHVEGGDFGRNEEKRKRREPKVLLRGPCDLDAMLYYLKADNIEAELTQKGAHGEFIYFRSHSQILRDAFNPPVFDSPFYEPNAYQTTLYSTQYDLIVISLLSESPFGVYEDAEGNRIVYGGAAFDACASPQDFLSGAATNGYPDLSPEDYETFAKRFRFLGRLSIDDTIRNLEEVVTYLPNPKARVCFLLGSTISSEEQNPSLIDVADYHMMLNRRIKELCLQRPNCDYIDPTPFIEQGGGGEGFYSTRSTTHYSRMTYQLIANNTTGEI